MHFKQKNHEANNLRRVLKFVHGPLIYFATEVSINTVNDLCYDDLLKRITDPIFSFIFEFDYNLLDGQVFDFEVFQGSESVHGGFK